MASLKILTLNCWGVHVPYLCKLRAPRIEAIADHVSKSDYDIAVFQEVWKKSDFKVMREKMGATFQYSHYFYSGVIGSGLCVFSRVPILETIYFKFDLNGYAHNIHHGDFFAGKGAGLAILDYKGFKIHLFVSHVHAEYNSISDQYLAHRVSQAFSMSQFMRYTSHTADLMLLCGDLNLEPVNLGFKLLRTNVGLRDAWIDKKNSSGDPTGNTCDCPHNSFTSKDSLLVLPDGKRIDYILYRPGTDVTVEIKECSVTMGKIPDRSYSFSDHEAVQAEIFIDKASDKKFPVAKTKDLPPLVTEAIAVIDKGMKKVQWDQKFFLGLLSLGLLVLYLMSLIHIPFPLDYVATVFKVVLTLGVGYSVIHTLITMRSEVHGLKATREDLKNYLQTLQKM